MAKQPNDKISAEEPKTPPANHETTNSRTTKINVNHQHWLYGAIAALVVLVAFAAGHAVAERHNQPVFTAGKFTTAPAGRGFSMRVEGGDGPHFRTGGGFEGGTSVSGQSHTMGVVTNVNGVNFTIAGNGATTQVTTNSSTKYQNGNQVKPNDSVIVVGTTSNGTLTATNIVINP